MELDGFAVAQNMPDLAEMWMDRFCSFVWWWATRNAQNQQDVEKLRATIWRPPPGEVAKVGPWTAEAEAQAFGAFKAQLGR